MSRIASISAKVAVPPGATSGVRPATSGPDSASTGGGCDGTNAKNLATSGSLDVGASATPLVAAIEGKKAVKLVVLRRCAGSAVAPDRVRFRTRGCWIGR